MFLGILTIKVIVALLSFAPVPNLGSNFAETTISLKEESMLDTTQIENNKPAEKIETETNLVKNKENTIVKEDKPETQKTNKTETFKEIKITTEDSLEKIRAKYKDLETKCLNDSMDRKECYEATIELRAEEKEQIKKSFAENPCFRMVMDPNNVLSGGEEAELLNLCKDKTIIPNNI